MKMRNNFLNNVKLNLVLTLGTIFFGFFADSCKAVQYNGIVVNQSIISVIQKKIDTRKLASACRTYEFSIDFSKMYVSADSSNIYKLQIIIPILNSLKTKVIGEIKNVITLNDSSEITAISFILNNFPDRSLSLRFGEMIAIFFGSDGTACAKYVPSIQQKDKLTVSHLGNRGYRYLPLKED